MISVGKAILYQKMVKKCHIFAGVVTSQVTAMEMKMESILSVIHITVQRANGMTSVSAQNLNLFVSVGFNLKKHQTEISPINSLIFM